MRGMHVFLVEMSLSGHHGIYLKNIVEAFLDAGANISLALRRKDLERWDSLWCRAHDRVHLFEMRDEDCARVERAWPSLVGKEIATRSLIARTFETVSRLKTVDLAFLPYADSCLYAVGLLGSPFRGTTWGGICMRPSFHHREAGIGPAGRLDRVKEALAKRVLRQPEMRCLLCLDELLPPYLKKSSGGARLPLRHLPDPATPPEHGRAGAARLAFGIPEAARVVLVFGAISRRKGMEFLLRAALDEQVPKSLVLLVVGEQSPDFRQSEAARLLEALIDRRRAFVSDKFVDQQTQDMAFDAADAVWLGYQGHYAMSNVLVLAAQSRKKVIATHEGLIGYHTRREGLGAAIDTTDIQSISAELVGLSRAQEWPRPSSTAFDQYTWPKFKQVLVHALSNNQCDVQERVSLS